MSLKGHQNPARHMGSKSLARLFIRRRFAMARPFPALRTLRSSKSGGGSRATQGAFLPGEDPGLEPGLEPRLRKAYVAAK